MMTGNEVLANDDVKFKKQKIKATFTIDRVGNGTVKLKGNMSERGAFEVARAMLVNVSESENVKKSTRMKLRRLIKDMEKIDDEREADKPKKKKLY